MNSGRRHDLTILASSGGQALARPLSVAPILDGSGKCRDTIEPAIDTIEPTGNHDRAFGPGRIVNTTVVSLLLEIDQVAGIVVGIERDPRHAWMPVGDGVSL